MSWIGICKYCKNQDESWITCSVYLILDKWLKITMNSKYYQDQSEGWIMIITRRCRPFYYSIQIGYAHWGWNPMVYCGTPCVWPILCMNNLNLHNTCKINIMEMHKVLKKNQRNLHDAESIKSLIICGI